MTIGDLFGHWEGSGRLVACNGSIVLAINGILTAMVGGMYSPRRGGLRAQRRCNDKRHLTQP